MFLIFPTGHYSPDHTVKIKKEPEIKKEKYWDRDVDRRQHAPRRDNFVVKQERRSPGRGHRSRSPCRSRYRRSPPGERYRRSDDRYRRSPVEEKYRPPSADYNRRNRQSRGGPTVKTEPGVPGIKVCFPYNNSYKYSILEKILDLSE